MRKTIAALITSAALTTGSGCGNDAGKQGRPADRPAGRPPVTQPASPAVQRDVQARIIDLVAEMRGLDKADVKLSSTFTDLGADSLDHVEIIMEVEKEFKIEIPDEDAEKLTTVGRLVDYVKTHAK